MKRRFSSALFFAFFVLLTAFSVTLSSAANLAAPAAEVTLRKSDYVKISWKSVKGADGYKIYTTQPDGSQKALASTKKTDYTVKSLKPNKSYTFAVRAFVTKKDGTRDFGKYKKNITVKTMLAPPAGVKLQRADENSITVAWDKQKGAVKYKVQYCEKNSDKFITAGITAETSMKISGIGGKNGFKIRVAAVGKDNSSPYAKPVTLYTVPPKIGTPAVTKVSHDAVTLKWNKVKSATKYYVYVCTEPNGKYSVAGKTSKTEFACPVKKASTKYYFKVRGAAETADQLSKGKPSDAVSAKSKPYPFKIQLNSTQIKKGEYIYLNIPHFKNVKWSTSNSKVISLSGSRAYANGTGSATITAKLGDKKTSVKIKVGAPVVNYMSCVFDVTNNKWVFSNKMKDRCYPASMTKLITALVALKYMKTSDVIVVGNELNMVEPMSSRCGIQRGEKFRLGDLLYGLLLPSGGDAAYTIAVNVARKVSGKPNMGYVEAKNYFVKLMNSYMKSLGAVGTHCVNPHGYPVNGHYSTAYDLCLVGKAVLKNPTLKKIVSTPSKYVKALTGKGRSWRTTNQLINPAAVRTVSIHADLKPARSTTIIRGSCRRRRKTAERSSRWSTAVSRSAQDTLPHTDFTTDIYTEKAPRGEFFCFAGCGGD